MRAIDLDKYLELKESKSIQVFIFTLKGQVHNLEFENHWVYHLNTSAYLVNCSEEDFKMMDIGVYPKVLVLKAGKELAQFNGLPEMEALQRELRSFI